MNANPRRRGTPPRIASSARKSAWTASGRSSGDDNFLAKYFKEMSSLSVMTPEEEQAAAIRIHDLRVSQWDAILSYPPYTVGICELISSSFDDEDVPHEALAELRIRSRCYRDRETRAHREAFEVARRALSRLMARVDVDGVVTDAVVHDLAILEVGEREGISLAVHPPRRGSRPFKVFASEVRARSAELRHVKNRFVKANLAGEDLEWATPAPRWMYGEGDSLALSDLQDRQIVDDRVGDYAVHIHPRHQTAQRAASRLKGLAVSPRLPVAIAARPNPQLGERLVRDVLVIERA